MFKQIAPQKAQDDAGNVVQVGDRSTVQYIEQGITFEVDADLLCEVVPIYWDTLRIRKPAPAQTALSSDDARLILDQVKEGLDSLGVKYELRKSG